MFDRVVLENCLVELPPFGSFPMRGFRKMPDYLLAEGAYFVTHKPGGVESQHIVGAGYVAGGRTYYVEYAKGKLPGGERDYRRVAESALLLPGEWDGRDRTRDISEVEGKLQPIPAEDKPTVVEALHAALLRDHNLPPAAAVTKLNIA